MPRATEPRNRAPGLPLIVAPAITPRNKHEEIDFGAAFEWIDLMCRAGVDGIALFTAIGEYASLAPDERSRFLTLAVKRSRVPVYAGIGAATLDSALSLARDAREAGAAALLLPPPLDSHTRRTISASSICNSPRMPRACVWIRRYISSILRA